MNKLILIMLMLSGCGSSPYGVVGPQGATGTTGQSGTSCTVTNVAIGQPGAPNGGSLLSCGDNSSLVLNGTPGNNGTSISPIQFCLGTTTYPNEFNEMGFCVEGNIYAIYSVNGGFMTLIPPGSYSSNAINSSCNFSVENNCVIVQN